jgi:nucleolar protein 56
MTINRELFFKEAQEKIKEELNTTDQKIILYSLISEKLPKNVNELFEQIRIITDLKYPTLDQYLTIEEYCNFLLDNSLEKLNTDKKKEIEKIISGEISITFDQNEQKLVNNFSKNILDLIVLKNDLDLEISNLLKENYPNFYLIATSKIAAKMLQISGSIKRLAKMPASTIQLLGSEKSFFKALKLSKNTPKYGVLYNHEILFDLNKKNKAKMARMIANKISIAVKSDLNKNNVSADLYEKIIRKKEELLNLQKK